MVVKSFRILCITVLFLLPTSCAKEVSNGPPKVSSIKQDIDLSEKEKEGVCSGYLAKGLWLEEKWWEMFSDSQLTSLIEAALKDSPTLQHVRSKVTQANQEAYIARAKLFPSLGALFSFFYTYFSKDILSALGLAINPNFHFYNLSLDFDYEFDFWGKNRRLYEIALGEARVQEAISAQTKLILSTAIAKEYFTLQANLIRFDLMQEILSNRIKMLDLLKLRKFNRIDNLIDLNGMKEEVVTFQKALVAVKEEIDLQKSLISTLIGNNPGLALECSSTWREGRVVPELPSCIGMNLLARRPDLAAQVWRVQKASKYVGVAITNFFPNIDLKAFGGMQSVNIQQLFQKNALTGAVLPFIKLPIFEGGRLKAYLKAKMAEYEASVHQYNELLLQAANEVVSDITKIVSVNEKISCQSENLEYAKQNYDLIYTRYRHGVDSMIAVLKSNEKFLIAKLELIELERMRFQNIVTLVKSLGGGFLDESAEKVAACE